MVKLATLIYVQKNGKTLMIHRNKKIGDMHSGKYNGLGGKFNPDESPEDCAKRELYEECGLVATKLNLKGILTFPNSLGSGDDWYVFVYIVTDFEGEIGYYELEGTLEWIDNDKLFDLPLNEGDYIFMKWFEKPGIFSAKFNYENKKLINYEVEFY